jgi:GNAT superfamily N-acetyltransferase
MTMEPININYQGYVFTTDKSLLQPEAVHKWLSEESYWAPNTTFDLVKTAFDNSYCIGVLKDGKQIGYGRFITDYATFCYLADVYILKEHRGQGLSKKMMDILLNLDWVLRMRRIMLATRDAHSLYEQFGFTRLTNPERYMAKTQNDSYTPAN